jgi:hypothetical protein
MWYQYRVWALCRSMSGASSSTSSRSGRSSHGPRVPMTTRISVYPYCIVHSSEHRWSFFSFFPFFFFSFFLFSFFLFSFFFFLFSFLNHPCIFFFCLFGEGRGRSHMECPPPPKKRKKTRRGKKSAALWLKKRETPERGERTERAPDMLAAAREARLIQHKSAHREKSVGKNGDRKKREPESESGRALAKTTKKHAPYDADGGEHADFRAPGVRAEDTDPYDRMHLARDRLADEQIRERRVPKMPKSISASGHSAPGVRADGTDPYDRRPVAGDHRADVPIRERDVTDPKPERSVPKSISASGPSVVVVSSPSDKSSRPIALWYAARVKEETGAEPELIDVGELRDKMDKAKRNREKETRFVVSLGNRYIEQAHDVIRESLGGDESASNVTIQYLFMDDDQEYKGCLVPSGVFTDDSSSKVLAGYYTDDTGQIQVLRIATLTPVPSVESPFTISYVDMKKVEDRRRHKAYHGSIALAVSNTTDQRRRVMVQFKYDGTRGMEEEMRKTNYTNQAFMLLIDVTGISSDGGGMGVDRGVLGIIEKWMDQGAFERIMIVDSFASDHGPIRVGDLDVPLNRVVTKAMWVLLRGNRAGATALLDVNDRDVVADRTANLERRNVDASDSLRAVTMFDEAERNLESVAEPGGAAVQPMSVFKCMEIFEGEMNTRLRSLQERESQNRRLIDIATKYVERAIRDVGKEGRGCERITGEGNTATPRRVSVYAALVFAICVERARISDAEIRKIEYKSKYDRELKRLIEAESAQEIKGRLLGALLESKQKRAEKGEDPSAARNGDPAGDAQERFRGMRREAERKHQELVSDLSRRFLRQASKPARANGPADSAGTSGSAEPALQAGANTRGRWNREMLNSFNSLMWARIREENMSDELGVQMLSMASSVKESLIASDADISSRLSVKDVVGQVFVMCRDEQQQTEKTRAALELEEKAKREKLELENQKLNDQLAATLAATRIQGIVRAGLDRNKYLAAKEEASGASPPAAPGLVHMHSALDALLTKDQITTLTQAFENDRVSALQAEVALLQYEAAEAASDANAEKDVRKIQKAEGGGREEEEISENECMKFFQEEVAKHLSGMGDRGGKGLLKLMKLTHRDTNVKGSKYCGVIAPRTRKAVSVLALEYHEERARRASNLERSMKRNLYDTKYLNVLNGLVEAETDNGVRAELTSLLNAELTTLRNQSTAGINYDDDPSKRAEAKFAGMREAAIKNIEEAAQKNVVEGVDSFLDTVLESASTYTEPEPKPVHNAAPAKGEKAGPSKHDKKKNRETGADKSGSAKAPERAAGDTDTNFNVWYITLKTAVKEKLDSEVNTGARTPAERQGAMRWLASNPIKTKLRERYSKKLNEQTLNEQKLHEMLTRPLKSQVDAVLQQYNKEAVEIAEKEARAKEAMARSEKARAETLELEKKKLEDKLNATREIQRSMRAFLAADAYNQQKRAVTSVQAAFRGKKERRRLSDQKSADAEAKENTNTGFWGWVSGLMPNSDKGKPVVEEPAPEQSEGKRRPAFGKQRTKMRGYV